MISPGATGRDLGRRQLSIVGFLGLVVVWLAVVKFVGVAAHDRADVVDGRYLTAGNVLWALVVPLGAGCVLIYGAIGVLGWWRPLLHEPRRVQRWVWVIPAVFAVAILAGINYGGLIDRGLGFTLTLLVAAAFIGFGEEGLFRCIGVTSLRRHGLREGRVALWSSVIFGLAHIANVIGGDATALVQAVVVSFAGYFFYLIRRVSGSNILNSILHGLFDFTLLSGTAIIPKGEQGYPGAVLGILVYLVCAGILLTRRHRIEAASTI